jgi:hypothetical protein
MSQIEQPKLSCNLLNYLSKSTGIRTVFPCPFDGKNLLAETN